MCDSFGIQLKLFKQFSDKYNNRRDGISEIQKNPTEIIHILQNLHKDKAVEKLVSRIRDNHRNKCSILGDILEYLFLEFIVAKPITEEHNSKTKMMKIDFFTSTVEHPTKH